MTGPEHYREAERFLLQHDPYTHPSLHLSDLAAAQVHATLALSAATLEVAAESGGGPSGIGQAAAWVEALS